MQADEQVSLLRFLEKMFPNHFETLKRTNDSQYFADFLDEISMAELVTLWQASRQTH